MCILFIAIKQHRDFPLIIAANRDEFHARPTEASGFWDDKQQILAGRDLQAGGTWMGINASGAIAALTNIRAPGREKAKAISRGELVSNFLISTQEMDDYHHTLSSSRERYNGYNLLFGNINKLAVYNNFEDSLIELSNGVYGLSNAMLNTPWPKLDYGKEALGNYCNTAKNIELEALFALLKNQEPAEDAKLPKTGVPYEWEKKLSSIFIQSPDYGTRSSTILLVDKHHQVYWQERSFTADTQEYRRREYQFAIDTM